eukprot:SAG31_NODE_3981_length_3699_cov_27.996389_2_plen_952_part_00
MSTALAEVTQCAQLGGDLRATTPLSREFMMRSNESMLEMKELVVDVESLMKDSKRRDKEILAKQATWDEELLQPNTAGSLASSSVNTGSERSTPAPTSTFGDVKIDSAGDGAYSKASSSAFDGAITMDSSAFDGATTMDVDRPRSVGFGDVTTSDKPLGPPDPQWHPGFADHHSGSLAYTSSYRAKLTSDQRDELDKLGEVVSTQVERSIALSYPHNGEERVLVRSIEQAKAAGKIVAESRNAMQDIDDFTHVYPQKNLSVTQQRRKGRTLGSEGELNVVVHEARGLPKMDRFGHTDSFVRLEFESSVQNTAVAPDTENPKFGSAFQFGVEDRNSPVSIVVFDKDATNDEPIGHAVMHITQGMIDGKEEHVWLDLQPLAGGLGDPAKKQNKSWGSYKPDISHGLGKIHISSTYIWQSVSGQREHNKKSELGILHVTVIRAKGLPKMDRWSHTDSYAQVELGDDIQLTSVAVDTEDPTWNEVLRFKIMNRRQLQSKLRLAVYDKDPTSADDVIGFFHFKLTEESILGVESEFWAPLERTAESPTGKQGTGKFGLGEVKIKVNYEQKRLPDWDPAIDGIYNPVRSAYMFLVSQSPVHSSLKKLKAKPCYLGSLNVGVMEAAGLPKMDFFGHTDAYVVVHVDGHTEQTPVHENSGDPIWNEEFSFDVQSRKHPIQVVVYDKDSTDDDDPIGQVLIPWGATVLPPNTLADEWHALQPMDDGRGPKVAPERLGKIRLRIAFVAYEKSDQGAALSRELSNCNGTMNVSEAKRGNIAVDDAVIISKKAGGKKGWGMLKKKVESEAKPREPLDVKKTLSIWKKGNPIRQAGKRLFAAAGKKLKSINLMKRASNSRKKSDTYDVSADAEQVQKRSGGFLSLFRSKTKSAQMVRALSKLPKDSSSANSFEGTNEQSRLAWPIASGKPARAAAVETDDHGGGPPDIDKRKSTCCIVCGLRMC